MRLAIILVHYRAAQLAARAVQALRADLEPLKLEHGLWIVDHGSDTTEREILRDLARQPGVHLLEPGQNRGYAGGVNLGVTTSVGDVILIMNPDVLVRPGCTAALLAELAGRAGVAGPRFYWDEEQRVLLPPGDQTSRWDAVLEVLAARSERAARWARRRWRRHARRHWSATTTLRSATLSGAMMAFRRDVWNRVGGFDEGYPLYFEETDWLRRVVAAGIESVHVPAAAAVHLHNQSAATEPRAGQWFETSARRFRERHHGRRFTRTLAAVTRRWPPRSLRGAEPVAGLEIPEAFGAGGWIELSPNPTGYPAAGEPVVGGQSWNWPPQVAARLTAGERWFFVLSDARGAEVRTGWLRV
jgi:N-acetylglucosaminyl-diphospho-decaprenol L-rhamnosyltransferase